MWFPNYHGLLASALLATCLMECRAGAGEATSEASTNRPGLRAVIRSEEIPDTTNGKPLQRAFFSSGTNRFTFILPEDFKLDASEPDKLMLTSPDYTCFMTVQLTHPGTDDAAVLTADFCRDLVLKEFPLAAVNNEFAIRAGNQGGPAYELQWKNSGGAQQRACVGFVPSLAGVLKFSMLSNLEPYPVNQAKFHCLLRSFQNNENGKLEVAPVSGAN